jgi:hypothetical protein
VVPRFRAALRSRSSRERGRVMFFLTCVAMCAIIHTGLAVLHTVLVAGQGPGRDPISELHARFGTRGVRPRLPLHINPQISVAAS